MSLNQSQVHETRKLITFLARNYEAFADSKDITNEQMAIYDTFYNGSYTMTLTPPSSKVNCPKITSQTMPSQFLQLGPQARDKASRSKYDKNPYYFRFGSTMNGTTCPSAPNKAFIGFASSNDHLKYTQPWTLAPVEKKGDVYTLKGEVKQVQASMGNYFFYTVNTTGADASYPNASCVTQFSQHALTATDAVSMTAEVGREKASMSFQFLDALTGYTVTGNFSGAAWTEGARLSTTSAEIVTEGKGSGPKPDSVLEKDAVKMIKYIVGGVVGGIVLLILLCIGCCCCSAAKKKRWKDGPWEACVRVRSLVMWK